MSERMPAGAVPARDHDEFLTHCERLRAMTELERAHAEIERLRRNLRWTADQWDRERCLRGRRERELYALDRRLARAELVVFSKLSWLIGFLEAAAMRVPLLETAVDRLEDVRRELRDGNPGLDGRDCVEDAA